MRAIVPSRASLKTEAEKIICAQTRCPCRDRKSTRLNSSHLVISYAVFCLKKKKVPHIRHTPSATHPSSAPMNIFLIDVSSRDDLAPAKLVSDGGRAAFPVWRTGCTQFMVI